MNENAIKDKIALVTGGSKGIGKAVGKLLAHEGAKVILVARNADELESARTELNKAGGTVYTYCADVGSNDEVTRIINKICTKFERLDILINNAGIGIFAPVTDFKVEDWHRLMNTNLHGPFYMIRAVLPQMIRQREGAIINIASLAAKNSFANGAAYCASKAGLVALSECLMLEVRYYNIKVSVILPGSVATDFGSGSANKNWMLNPEDIAQQAINIIKSKENALISHIEMRPLKPEK